MSNYSRRDMGFWYHQEYDPVRNGSMDGTDILAHDHGLIRAYHNHYDSTKDPDVQGDPYRTLFVGRLSVNTTEETLRAAFSRYGKVKSIRLVRDVITGCSKGYGFVEYVYDEDFRSAFFAAHKTRIDDMQILVDFMREQTVPGWVPRRLGGGVGGRKQSGQMRFGGRDCPFRAPFDIAIYRNRQNVRNAAPSGSVKREDEGDRQASYRRDGDGHGGVTRESERYRDGMERLEERKVDHRDERKVDHREEKSVDHRDDRRSHTHDTSRPHEERSSANRHHSSRHSHERSQHGRERSRSHRRERSRSQERRERSRSRDDKRDDHHRTSSRHHDRSRSYHTHRHYSVCEKKNAQAGDRTQDLRVISTTL